MVLVFELLMSLLMVLKLSSCTFTSAGALLAAASAASAAFLAASAAFLDASAYSLSTLAFSSFSAYNLA